MARIRSIKPEFWTDEKLSLLDPLTRLVFLGLVSLADDAGRLLDNVKLLDGQLFPNTDDTCRDALDILARLSRIARYTSESGQNLIQIVGWDKHQKVDHPNKYVLPAPSPEQLAGQWVPRSSRNPREILASESRNPRDTISDQGPTINDQGSGTSAADAAAARPTSAVERIPVADVERVLQHYHGRHPLTRPFTPQNRKVIRARLRDGYTPEELCAAIDGNADDDWHRLKCKHRLDYVLRSGAMVDEFRAMKARDSVPIVTPDGELTPEGLRLVGLAR